MTNSDADCEEPPTLSERVVCRAPGPLVQDPERLFLNFLFLLFGLLALIYRPGSIRQLWPMWVQYEWAAVMCIGGALSLYGLWKHTPIYRIGHVLSGFACLVYGIAILVVFGGHGVGTGIIFLGMGLMKVWRLVVDSASRNRIIRRGSPWGNNDGEFNDCP